MLEVLKHKKRGQATLRSACRSNKRCQAPFRGAWRADARSLHWVGKQVGVFSWYVGNLLRHPLIALFLIIDDTSLTFFCGSLRWIAAIWPTLGYLPRLRMTKTYRVWLAPYNSRYESKEHNKSDIEVHRHLCVASLFITVDVSLKLILSVHSRMHW